MQFYVIPKLTGGGCFVVRKFQLDNNQMSKVVLNYCNPSSCCISFLSVLSFRGNVEDVRMASWGREAGEGVTELKLLYFHMFEHFCWSGEPDPEVTICPPLSSAGPHRSH